MPSATPAAFALDPCPCPLCGSEERSAARYRFAPFGVVRCLDCRLWYLFPRVDEAATRQLYADAAYYGTADGQGYADCDYGLQEEALRQTFRRFLEALAKRRMTGGALLDVGCAYGYLLDEASPFFARRWGVDMSRVAATAAARLADETFVGDLDAVPREARFDTITAVQVIEHVYEPLAVVRQAAARLVAGGWLVLATPDMGSPWRLAMQQRWPSFKIPEHVTYFDQRSLADLLHQAGLTDIRKIPYPHAFPLSLVASKLGWHGVDAHRSLWIPGTTIALGARRS